MSKFLKRRNLCEVSKTRENYFRRAKMVKKAFEKRKHFMR